MTVDIPTTLAIQVLTTLTTALILAGGRSAHGPDGLAEARAGTLILVPAFALQFLRGHLPDVITIVGSNVGFWLTCALIVRSYQRFIGFQRLARWPFVLVGVAAVIFAAAWAAGANYVVRAMFTSMMIGTLLATAGYQLAANGGLVREPSRKVSFALILVTAVPQFLRVLVLLPHVREEMTPFSSPLEGALGFFPGVILAQGFGLGFLLMQRERSEAVARTQAITDALTGCLNRRALEDRVRQELAHATRSNQPFALLVADLDFFKKVNDTHGHAVGDAVLVHAARVLREQVRPSDVLARYGGEEFCVLLRNVDEDLAAKTAARLGQAIRKTPLEEPVRISLTMSVGVSSYRRGAGEAWEELFKRADGALYRAKQNGRDRFEVA